MTVHLRVARATDDLETIAAMYRDGLGFEELGSFSDHDGFDGVMLGHPGAGYHLEFTSHPAHPAGRASDAEHLLVFYLPDHDEWQEACAAVGTAGFVEVEPINGYWARHGRTFEDPDGYRVVLQQSAWPADDQPLGTSAS